MPASKWGARLLMLLGLSAACTGPSFPRTERGPCDDFDKDVERFWSHSTKADVRAGILVATGEYAESLSERVVTKMDAVTRDWVMMQESLCKDTVVRKVTPPEVYTKVAACMRVALISQRTLVEAMRSPNKDQAFKLDDAVLAIGRNNAECQKEAVWTAYVARESDRTAVLVAQSGASTTSVATAVAETGTGDLDVAQQALGQAYAYENIADARKWAEALDRGLAAARRANEPHVLVDLLISDAMRLRWLAANYDASLMRSREAAQLAQQIGYERGLASSEFQIAGAYFNQAKHAEALQSYRRALAAFERLFGSQTPNVAVIYVSIGLVCEAQANYQEALEWHLKALAIFENLGTAEYQNTAKTYASIANVYIHQGKYAQGIEWNLKALPILEQALGKAHPNTATIYGNIGIVYEEQGKYAEALEWYLKALGINERVLGKDHPTTAMIYNNLCVASKEQRKYAEAVEWCSKALAVYERALGSEHPHTARVYSNLGNAYLGQRNPGEAVRWYLKALAVYERTLGREHPETAATYSNLGGAYFIQGKDAEGFEYLRKALVIIEKVFGRNHPNGAKIYGNIRTICREAQYEPACAFLREHPR